MADQRNGLAPGRLKAEHMLYVRSMGKALRVTAMFTDDDAANAYMANHRDEGVVAVVSGIILLANLHDQGVTIADRRAP